MKLFNLSKSIKGNTCEARRCKETGAEFPGFLWGKETVNLCEKHAQEAVEYAEKNPKPVKTPATSSNVVDPDPVEVIKHDQEMEQLAKDSEVIKETLKGFILDTPEKIVQARDFLVEIQGNRHRIEVREKEESGKLQAKINELRDYLKPMKDNWSEAEESLRRKIEEASAVI